MKFHSFTKLEMKKTIEDTFNVRVISVNSSILSHKNRRVGKIVGSKNFYKRIFIKLV